MWCHMTCTAYRHTGSWHKLFSKVVSLVCTLLFKNKFIFGKKKKKSFCCCWNRPIWLVLFFPRFRPMGDTRSDPPSGMFLIHWILSDVSLIRSARRFVIHANERHGGKKNSFQQLCAKRGGGRGLCVHFSLSNSIRLIIPWHSSGNHAEEGVMPSARFFFWFLSFSLSHPVQPSV